MNRVRRDKRGIRNGVLDAVWPPAGPGDSHVKVAWQYLTSWWLRMAVLVAAVALTVVMIIGFERDVVYWLYRLLGFIAMFGFIYDRRVRIPRERERVGRDKVAHKH